MATVQQVKCRKNLSALSLDRQAFVFGSSHVVFYPKEK